MSGRFLITGAVGTAVVACAASTVHAGSHLWRISEVFSNANGDIQFVELKECCGATSETGLNGKWVLSETAGKQFDFPGNITGNTANRFMLLATPGFAVQPGAPPTPDYLLEPRFFDHLAAETIRYWNYGLATVELAAGEVPTDGTLSLRCNVPSSTTAQGCTIHATAVNSPTNFDGTAGSIDAPCRLEDTDNNGAVDIDDIVAVVLDWGPNPDSPANVDLDATVGIDDLVAIVIAFGPCQGR